MTDAFRCDGCGEFFDAREQLLDLDLNTDAVVSSDVTLDDIEEAYDIVWDGAQGDFCVACGRDALDALVELFVDDAADGGTDQAGEPDAPPAGATDADVEAAVDDDDDELPEFEEALAGSDEDSEDDHDAESLTPTAEEVVDALEDHGELPSAELKHITQRSLQAISSNLNDLEATGRVESRPDPEDGRRQLYALVDDTNDTTDEHRVGDPLDEDGAGATETEADGGVTTDSSGLPTGLTAQDVRDAVDAADGRQREGHAYLDDVADELNVRRTRARVFAYEVGVYDRVTDASGHKGGAE